MTSKIIITTIYHCSLEKAFKTPMLCDITKVHTGFGLMPKVTHCTDDEMWGQPNFSKKVFMSKTLAFAGGEASTDKVIKRIENEYWKIEVGNFTSWMLGFEKFVGEWKTTEIAAEKIQITYSYTMYSSSILLYPFHWLFTNTFWRIYMKQVLENIRQMINNNEPYLYK